MPAKKEVPYRIERANIDFDVFGYGVTVVFSTDLQRARNEYNKIIGRPYDIGGSVGAFHTAVDKDFDPRSFVFFHMNPLASTVTHESWHVINRMFEHAGVVDWDNEVCAYHVGWLVGQITAFRRSFNKKKKEKKTDVVNIPQRPDRTVSEL